MLLVFHASSPQLIPGHAICRADNMDMSAYQTRHVALEVAYLGAQYHGLASQANTEETVEVHANPHIILILTLTLTLSTLTLTPPTLTPTLTYPIELSL